MAAKKEVELAKKVEAYLKSYQAPQDAFNEDDSY
jgi:hypothetical protein